MAFTFVLGGQRENLGILSSIYICELPLTLKFSTKRGEKSKCPKNPFGQVRRLESLSRHDVNDNVKKQKGAKQ